MTRDTFFFDEVNMTRDTWKYWKDIGTTLSTKIYADGMK